MKTGGRSDLIRTAISMISGGDDDGFAIWWQGEDHGKM